MPILLFFLLSFEHQIECGDPTMESMAWRVLEGDVLSVKADGDLTLTNVVESFNHLPPRFVRFTDVDVDAAAAQPFLKKLIGKRVSVWISGKLIDDDHVIGVVYLGDSEADINRALLAQGLGRYVVPPSYSMSDYIACLHRIAEREAREHHRGLWKK